MLRPSVVEVPDAFPEKWDLANDLPEGETYADIERLVEQAASIEMPEIRPPKYSDDSLALQLTERHEDELRYLQRGENGIDGAWTIGRPRAPLEYST